MSTFLDLKENDKIYIVKNQGKRIITVDEFSSILDIDERMKVEDEFKDIVFPINRTDTVANLPGTALDMYDDKHVYRFMFSERKSSTKYVLAIEEMYKQKNN